MKNYQIELTKKDLIILSEALGKMIHHFSNSKDFNKDRWIEMKSLFNYIYDAFESVGDTTPCFDKSNYRLLNDEEC